MSTNTHFGNMHGGHTGKDEWFTPKYIFDDLGEFDLDPCTSLSRPWDTAKEHLTIYEDGLSFPWNGRIWLNPPYGNKTGEWMNRLSSHGNGIALVFARTETKWFHAEVWEKATGILFMKGRIKFYNIDGVEAKSPAGAPSCLIAYGMYNFASLSNSNLPGYTIYLRP